MRWQPCALEAAPVEEQPPIGDDEPGYDDEKHSRQAQRPAGRPDASRRPLGDDGEEGNEKPGTGPVAPTADLSRRSR